MTFVPSVARASGHARTPFRARWYHIGCRGAAFAADSRVHDAPFVSSAEDEWTVIRLGHAFGCALDASEPIDVPADMRPEAIFNGRT